jgi:hypothetical protein
MALEEHLCDCGTASEVAVYFERGMIDLNLPQVV